MRQCGCHQYSCCDCPKLHLLCRIDSQAQPDAVVDDQVICIPDA
jgi:hypothetical protein